MTQKPEEVTQGENEWLESVDPTGFWRFVFWFAYVLGTMDIASCWLLALVPRSIHNKDFTLEYTMRSCAAGLMLISILMAKWLWKIRNPITDRAPALAMRLVVCFAWIEGAFAIVSMIAIGLFHP